MKIKIVLFLVYFLVPTFIMAQSEKAALYKDNSLSSEQRAKDLLSRMTDDEKSWQLMSVWLSDFSYMQAKDGALDMDKMQRKFGDGVNSVQPTFGEITSTVEERNYIQKYLLENTRLGIPALFVDEGLHGLMRPQSTVFPQVIGLASSWNPELVQEVYDVIGREMRSRGTTLALSPVIDITRDPRWGRTEETFGEDPFLNSQFGIAAVRGLQGSSDGTIDKNHVGATLKHFCGHGQSEGGINQAPANISPRVLYETHFVPFKATIKNASPIAVMPSYNEIDGIPSHSNKWLLNDVLRNEFGFEGLIVSDYNGISQLEIKHHVATDTEDAAEMAFNAGVQIELPTGRYYKKLPELVAQGCICKELVDSAVYQVLKHKFDLGLFDNPYINKETAIEVSKKRSSKELALKAAQESIVLLKNDGVLPLSKTNLTRIAVIGPGSTAHLYGGYSGAPYAGVNLFEGIQTKVGDKVDVVTAQGVLLTTNAEEAAQINWQTDSIKFPTHEANLELIKEAIEVAKSADVIILAIGENEQLCREAWAQAHLGDNMTLDLLSDQNELADSVLNLGKPVVVYLQNGRPLSINKLNDRANAIIEGWYMGQEAGTIAADIIFGDVNPSGKLTISFPKSVGQLPVFYNHKPSAQYHDYVSMENEPLYPFGFGLSYTTFSYSEPKLTNSTMKAGDSTIVSVTVTNTGEVKGDEIVQMYIRDEVSSVTRPIKELKGFNRISLEPGESKDVKFLIDSSLLEFYNLDMKQVVEPGYFSIMVGPSSSDYMKVRLEIVE